MVAETKLTTKGQLVIPKPIRDRLGWQAGARLRVATLFDGTVRLELLKDEAKTPNDDPIALAFGCLSDGDPVADLEQEHRGEIATDERWRRGR